MEARQAKVSQINLNLNVLLRQKKDVERELYELAVAARAGDSPGGGADAPQKLCQLEEKLGVLEGGIKLKTAEIAKAEAMASDVSTAVRETSQSSICRLMVELETGGNIRLEDGKPSDMWYSSCVDLVNSRFLPAAYADLGIESLRVTRVTRIHNRQLRNRFEERLEQMVNTADFAYKRSLEYLFYGEHPKLAGEFARVMEEGFRPPEQYVTSYGDAAVPLSNSLCISDLSRLKALAEQGAPPAGGQGGPMTSRLLITKVFLARCAQEKPPKSGGAAGHSTPICQADYEGFSSVYRIIGADGKQRQWCAPRAPRARAAKRAALLHRHHHPPPPPTPPHPPPPHTHAPLTSLPLPAAGSSSTRRSCCPSTSSTSSTSRATRRPSASRRARSWPSWAPGWARRCSPRRRPSTSPT